MPNFKVISEVPGELLSQVSQPYPASLLAQVSNPVTPASLLAQVSNPTTPASLLAQVSNPTTPASLLALVSNPTTPASLLAQVSNPTTPASLLAQVSNPTTPSSLLAQVSNPTTPACLLAQVSVSTGASFPIQMHRATTEVTTNVADTGDTTFKTAPVHNVMEWATCTFTVRNTGSNSAVCRLQLSPDSVVFSNDPATATATIAAAGQAFFVPGIFTKYAQLQYSSQTATLTTSLTVFWQAHS